MMDVKEIEDKVERVLCQTFGGLHHVHTWGRREVNATVHGIKMSLHTGTLQTFDADALTRLVVAAHDECVRVEITGGTPGYITCWFHVRDGREGRYWQKHPTMEQALAKIRADFDADGKPAEQPAGKEAINAGIV